MRSRLITATGVRLVAALLIGTLLLGGCARSRSSQEAASQAREEASEAEEDARVTGGQPGAPPIEPQSAHQPGAADAGGSPGGRQGGTLTAQGGGPSGALRGPRAQAGRNPGAGLSDADSGEAPAAPPPSVAPVEPPPDPLEALGYTLHWSQPVPAGDRPGEVVLGADGERLAYRSEGKVHILERGGRRREIPVARGQSLALPPRLDGWFVKSANAPGKLQAFDRDGRLRWETEASPGAIHVAPEGQLLLVTRPGEGNVPGQTQAFDSDGTPLWQTDEVGGEISFAADGSVLIWDPSGAWQIRSADGALLRDARLTAGEEKPLRLSRDGRLLVDPGSGFLRPLAFRAPDEEEVPAARDQQPFQGPGALFATDGIDLYIFLKYMGRHSRLEAFSAAGWPLWSIPAAGAQEGMVSPDSGEVWLAGGEGITVVDGATGKTLLQLAGARGVRFSPDGRFALIWDERAFRVYLRGGSEGYRRT